MHRVFIGSVTGTTVVERCSGNINRHDKVLKAPLAFIRFQTGCDSTRKEAVESVWSVSTMDGPGRSVK
ncbi:hypothetical protein TNCV_3172971, partial [Trichonephila clavipes]